MGEIEWLWRRAFEGVRAWLLCLKLPIWFWLEAISAWVYVRNRLPSRRGNATVEELRIVEEWEAGAGVSGPEGGESQETVSGEPVQAQDSVLKNGGGSFTDAPPMVHPILPVSPSAQNDDAPVVIPVASEPSSDEESSSDEEPAVEEPRQVHRTQQRDLAINPIIQEAPPTVFAERGRAMFDTPEPSPEPENTIALDATALISLATHPLLLYATHDTDIEDDAETIALKVWSLNPDEPSYRSVMKGPDRHCWDPAISSESASLRAMGCWDEALVDLPAGFRAIPLKFVLLIKRDAVGTIIKYKARLVARGDLQQEGDYGETFAPTIKMASFRNIAYLHGKLQEEVYLKQVPGEDDGTGRVRRLRKTLYGLKQSGHEWNNVFHAALLEIGFVQINADAGVYYRKRGKLELILGIHVDDGAIVGNDSIPGVIEDLNKRFEIKDLGELREVLGLQIDHNHDTGEVHLHQLGYAQRILE
ncbi:hypothetical protein P7C70_g7039, partial [Phenoliferia sp. Uapishka_3]